MARIKIEDLPVTATMSESEAKGIFGGRVSVLGLAKQAANLAGNGVEYVGDQVRAATGGNRITDTERTLTNFLGGVEGFFGNLTSLRTYTKSFKDLYGKK